MPAADIDYNQLQIKLDSYSQNSLLRIYDALALRQGQDKPRKVDLMSALARFLGQPQHLRVVEPLLSPQHWQGLAIERLKYEEITLYALIFRLQAQGMNGAEALDAVNHLLIHGCLIYSPDPHYGKIELSRLHLDRPYDLKRLVSSFPLLIDSAFQRAERPGCQVKPAPAPAQVENADFSEMRRLTYLMLQQAENGLIRLTMAGLPHKTDAAKLAAALGEQSLDRSSEQPSGRRQNKRNKQQPSPRMWFALSVLMEYGLLVADEYGRLRATAGMKEFLQLPAHEQARALHDAWLDCRFDEFGRIETLEIYPRFQDPPWVAGDPESIDNADRPNWRRLMIARRAIERILRFVATSDGDKEWIGIAELATATWTDDPEFLVELIQPGYFSYFYGSREREAFQRPYNSIHRRGKDYKAGQLAVGKDWPEVEGAFVAQVMVEPLHWLGLVDLGLDAAGVPVSFRLSPLGRQVMLGEGSTSAAVAKPNEPALIVQPNFELVVVNVDASFGLLAQLDQFAERRSLHNAAIYRLTHESVVHGLEKELTGQGIIELLEGASRRLLPQNVRYSIEEWANLYERVHVRQQATLLEADSPKEMDSWLADSVLSRLIGKRLSPVTALVSSEHCDEVTKLLKVRKEHLSIVDYAHPAKHPLSVELPAVIIVSSKHDEPYLRYRLGRLADRLEGEGGTEVRYRITPESVSRATASGITAAEIVSFLVNMAVQPVPADVILRIRGWGGVYKPLRYDSVVAVQLPLGLTWSELQAAPEIAGLGLRCPEPTLALVAVDKFEALRAALAARGIVLEVGLSDPDQAPPPQVVPIPGPARRPAVRPRTLEMLARMIGLRVKDEDDDLCEDEDGDLWED